MALVLQFKIVVLCSCVPLPVPEWESWFNDACMKVISDSSRCQIGWQRLSESLDTYLFKQACEEGNGNHMHNAATCFAPYFEIFPIPSSINPTLLWSGIPKTASILTNKAVAWGINLTTSSTLEAAKIIDKMEEEGTPSFTHFWGVSGCNDKYRFFFWREISRLLAFNSDDIVFYLTPGIYNETNYFGLYELPTLLNKNSKAKKLVVLNVILTGEHRITCEDDPLIKLKLKVISERSTLNFSCHNVDNSNNTNDHNDILIERLIETIKNATDNLI